MDAESRYSRVQESVEAIAAYRSARHMLLHQYLALSGDPSGPWTARCTRATKDGDIEGRGVVDLPEDGIDKLQEIEMSGLGVEAKAKAVSELLLTNAARGAAVFSIRNRNPLAPFNDFALCDRNGNRPAIGTPMRQTELNIEFLLQEILAAVTTLAQVLPELELAGEQDHLPVDTTTLTRLRHQLPEFPFVWANGQSVEERKRELIDEKPLLDDAVVVLQKLALRWRDEANALSR